MDDIGKLITVSSAALGLVGIVALIVAFYRVSVTKQTMELLRGDRDDANTRAEGIRADLETYKEKVEAKVKTLQDQVLAYEVKDSEKSQEIMILRSVVTGKDQLDRIEKVLTQLSERFLHDKATEQTRT